MTDAEHETENTPAPDNGPTVVPPTVVPPVVVPPGQGDSPEQGSDPVTFSTEDASDA